MNMWHIQASYSSYLNYNMCGVISPLPISNAKNVILLVVDRMTKYAHFLTLAYPFSASSIARLFLDRIYTLHGMPQSIVINKDKIFTSEFW